MKASDWISVKDRLPELYCDSGSIKFSGEVLLCLGNDEVLTARFATKVITQSFGVYQEAHTLWKKALIGNR